MTTKSLSRRGLFITAICAAAILSSAATMSVQAQFNYTTLNVPGSTNTYAYGISGTNIVGSYNTAGSQGAEGFLYNGSTYTSLSVSGAGNTYASGISGTNIVGYYTVGTGSTQRGFLYNGHTYTTLSALEGETVASAIDGTNIVGFYSDGINGLQGFLYNGSTYTTLSVPGATETYATGISGTNIVGYCYYNGSSPPNFFEGYQGFLYNGSTYTTFSVPGEAGNMYLGFTYAYGISGNNIVGSYGATNGENLVFLYNMNNGTYTTLNVPGATNSYAYGMSGNNIVGGYMENGTNYGFLATYVPFNLTGAAVGGQFQLVVSGPTNEATIQASTNLASWVNIYTNTPPFTFTDSAAAAFPYRFYRGLMP